MTDAPSWGELARRLWRLVRLRVWRQPPFCADCGDPMRRWSTDLHVELTITGWTCDTCEERRREATEIERAERQRLEAEAMRQRRDPNALLAEQEARLQAMAPYDPVNEDFEALLTRAHLESERKMARRREAQSLQAQLLAQLGNPFGPLS